MNPPYRRRARLDRFAMAFGLLALACDLWATRASAQQIGTAESGPATGDGSAPYYNPAAMALGDSVIDLDLGVTLIGVRFDPSATPTSTRASGPSPQLTLGAYTDALHRDVRIGFTFGLPALSGGRWNRNGENGDITRYYLVDGRAVHVGGALSLGWRPTPWLMIGAGVQLLYGRTTSVLDKDFGAELNTMSGCSYQRDDCVFPYADQLFAAPVDVTMSGFGAGGIFGLVLRPLPNLELGASVHTPVNIRTPGTIDVVYPDTLVDAARQLLPEVELPPLNADMEASMNLPWAVHASVVYRPIPALELNLYYRWDQQSAAPFWQVRITQTSSPAIQDTNKAQGFTNRHAARLRVGYAVLSTLNVSAFGEYRTNTVPEATASPNAIDFARIELGLLARWRVHERLALLVQYSYLHLQSRTTRSSLLRPTTDAAFADFNRPTPTGRWSGHANSIRVGLQVRFDRTQQMRR
ncbi:MAG: outer membrane protein transport protein [Myxococcota bacterium]